MKAIVRETYGSPDVLQLKAVPVPTIGDGDVLVRVRAASANAGEARGQMLATRTGTPGSAGYVALDRFEGTLDGRVGGFSLQHSGTMDRGAPTLSIHVIPDSGTGELAGLRGTLAIRIEDGAHFYDFDYRFVD